MCWCVHDNLLLCIYTSVVFFFGLVFFSNLPEREIVSVKMTERKKWMKAGYRCPRSNNIRLQEVVLIKSKESRRMFGVRCVFPGVWCVCLYESISFLASAPVPESNALRGRFQGCTCRKRFNGTGARLLRLTQPPLSFPSLLPSSLFPHSAEEFCIMCLWAKKTVSSDWTIKLYYVQSPPLHFWLRAVFWPRLSLGKPRISLLPTRLAPLCRPLLQFSYSVRRISLSLSLSLSACVPLLPPTLPLRGE